MVDDAATTMTSRGVQCPCDVESCSAGQAVHRNNARSLSLFPNFTPSSLFLLLVHLLSSRISLFLSLSLSHFSFHSLPHIRSLFKLCFRASSSTLARNRVISGSTMIIIRGRWNSVVSRYPSNTHTLSLSLIDPNFTLKPHAFCRDISVYLWPGLELRQSNHILGMQQFWSTSLGGRI